MSYNNIKVNSISSSSANVTINLENLSNTSFSSLANDHILKYDGTNWINSALSSSAKEYIFIGEGASQPYSGSGHTSIAASNHVISVYDSSPINTISNASFSYKDSDSSTNWIISITLPAGKYNVIAQTKFEFDNENGLVAYNITTSDTSTSGWLTAIAVTGHKPNLYEGSASTLQSCFELSSATTVYFRMDDYDGVETVANQGNTPSENTYVYIEKLSYS